MTGAGCSAVIQIWFQGHAQTQDNVDRVASGHRDAELTDAGRTRASTDWRQRYSRERFDAVFTSDTQRAYQTALLIFEARDVHITQDARLRECDYGDLTGRSRGDVAAFRQGPPDEPFPNGESYAQVAERMRAFLRELGTAYDGQKVMIVGHSATFWLLKHLLDGIPIGEALSLDVERSAVFAYEPGSLDRNLDG